MFRVANLRSLPAPSRSASCTYVTGLRSDPRLQIAKIYKYRILQQNAIIGPVGLPIIA